MSSTVYPNGKFFFFVSVGSDGDMVTELPTRKKRRTRKRVVSEYVPEPAENNPLELYKPGQWRRVRPSQNMRTNSREETVDLVDRYDGAQLEQLDGAQLDGGSCADSSEFPGNQCACAAYVHTFQ